MPADGAPERRVPPDLGSPLIPDICVPGLLAHQAPIADHPARNKLVRAGRRFGKSRLALYCAVLGHGPDGALRGLVAGLDVIWLAPDYPQAATIWKEDVLRLFSGYPQVQINQQSHSVTLPNGATLYVRSAEAIEGIRGMGKRLGGIVVDEAAHLDLEYALRNVLRPALLDNQGWLLLVSTPYAGSYFNALCTEVTSGARGDDWQHWHGTPWDNPKLSREEIAQLVGEYPVDSPQLQQEVHAELITAGGGLAFPEWRTDLHVVRAEPASHARWFAGMDWGYRSPGCFVLLAAADESTLVRWEYPFREQTPYDVGHTIGLRLREWPLHIPEWIAADSAMWAVTQGGPSIAEEVQRGLKDALRERCPAVLSTPKGTGSRVSGKMLIHQALQWTAGPDGTVPAWSQPALRFHRDCAYAIRSIPALPRDERNPEDVDSSADDHCLIAGTAVTTDRGPVPIEAMSAGDRVLTRSGWHPVAKAWQTSPSAEVYTVTLSDGRTITVTANHRFRVSNAVSPCWVRCDALSYGDILTEESAWKSLWSLAEPSKCLTASGTGSAVAISPGRTALDPLGSGDGPTSTGWSGSATTAGSPTESMSTMWTTTPPIITQTTSSSWWSPRISPTTAIPCPSPSGEPSSAMSAARWQGMPDSPQRSVSTRASGDGRLYTVAVPPRRSALSVAATTPPGSLGGPSSAAGPAVRVISVVAAGKAAVYNLHVTGCHEFFANGILVHNCYDALRYALMSREPIAERPMRDAPEGMHPGFLPNGQRRARHRSPEVDAEEELQVLVSMGHAPGGRYGLRA